MYCKYCGKEIVDNAFVCPHCGVQVAPVANIQNNNPTNENTIAIVGFVLSFFIAIAGLVCSIIGYKNGKNGAPYKNLGLAGIIISIVAMVITFISIIIYISLLSEIITHYPPYYY